MYHRNVALKKKYSLPYPYGFCLKCFWTGLKASGSLPGRGGNKGGVELLFSENDGRSRMQQCQDVCALNSNQIHKKIPNKKPLLSLKKEMGWDHLVEEFR